MDSRKGFGLRDAILFAVVVFLLTFSRTTTGLASGGLYTIQNVGDKMCITSGPIVELTEETPIVVKGGMPLTRKCTFGSPDQQWIVSLASLQTEGRRKSVSYNIRQLSSATLDARLHAGLRGEFVIYFPHPLLLPRSSFVSRFTSIHGMIDGVDGKCLESSGDNHLLLPSSSANCTQGRFYSPRQLWRFTLVNDPSFLLPPPSSTPKPSSSNNSSSSN